MSVILTLGSNEWTLIPLPANVGFVDVSFTMTDGVAVVDSPYDPSQTQTQVWPGADFWSVQFSLPKMTELTAGYWKAFMGALRGRANVFQLGDLNRLTPLGVARGAPVVNGGVSGGNAVSSTQLYTRGWAASVYRQLLPGDYLQVGYRLHMAVAEADSDSSGNAIVQVWPSLRETPADGTAINLIKPIGVFRLASNQRQWHTTVDRLSQLSLKAMEQK
jgi:hypothetical protein